MDTLQHTNVDGYMLAISHVLVVAKNIFHSHSLGGTPIYLYFPMHFFNISDRACCRNRSIIDECSLVCTLLLPNNN